MRARQELVNAGGETVYFVAASDGSRPSSRDSQMSEAIWDWKTQGWVFTAEERYRLDLDSTCTLF